MKANRRGYLQRKVGLVSSCSPSRKFGLQEFLTSKPVRDILSRAGKCAPGDHQCAVIGTSSPHGIVRVSGHHRAVKAVRVVLDVSAALHDIRVCSAVRQRWAGAVLNHIRRPDELAVGQTSALVGSAARAGFAAVLPASLWVSRPVADRRPPAASTELAVRLRPSPTFDGDNRALLVCLVRSEVWLEAIREPGDRGIWPVPHGRWLRGVVIRLGKLLRGGVVAWVGAVVEVGGLVHVDPQRINVRAVDAVEEVEELLRPVFLSVRVEPVREVTGTGPNDTLVMSAVQFLHERIVLQTGVERRVWLAVVDSRINHDNVMLISRVKSVHKVFDQLWWEPFGIKREDAPTVHVVDIRPDSLQWDIVDGVVGGDSGHLVDILVAVPALVETESPVRNHQRRLDNFSILPGHILRGRSGDEVEVKNAADDVVLEELAALVVDVDVHPVGVKQEHTVSAVLPVIEIDRVSSVQILALGRPVSITGVDRSGVVGGVEHEGVAMLSQTIQMRVLRQVRLQIEILVLEHELGAGSVEEHLAGVCARDRERERVGVEVKLEFRVLGRAPLAEARAREDAVWHLVNCVVGVQDLDVQSLIGLILDFELQLGQIDPVHIACWPGERQVRIETGSGLPVLGDFVPSAVRKVLYVEVIAGTVERIDASLALGDDAASQGRGPREQLLKAHLDSTK